MKRDNVCAGADGLRIDNRTTARHQNKGPTQKAQQQAALAQQQAALAQEQVTLAQEQVTLAQQRSDKLATKLREMGINPDEI